jgi:hypothetical protein
MLIFVEVVKDWLVVTGRGNGGGPLWDTRIGSCVILQIHSRGRAPRSGFSDWPAQQKTTKKKGRPLKFFIHYFKLQAGTSDDDYHTESQLIRPVTRLRPTTACSGQLALRKKAGVKREGGDTHRSLCPDFHQKCQLVIWNGG